MRDVNIKITDGGLGASGSSGTGIHVKIGSSPASSEGYITVTNTMDAAKIKELLGDCPLADAVMDSIASGCAKIYCYPVQPSTNGTVSDVTTEKSGTGTLTIEGNPNNAYSVSVEITKSGASNTGTFIYTINGGGSWSDDITIPVDGSYADTVTGLIFKFSNESASFNEGDKFTFSTTAPSISNSDVLDAIAKVKNLTILYEFIHIVGSSSKSLWASMAVEAQNFETAYKNPVFFVCEAPNITQGQTMDTYTASLLDERKGLASKYVQVVAARALYTKMDGSIKDVNVAGIICGLYSRADINQSIGEVREFPVQGILKLLPAGMEDYISTLDEAKYVTLRQYTGIEGYYVTNAWTMAPSGSDYQYAERIRVSNELVKQTRKAALVFMQSRVDMADVDKSLSLMAEEIQIPLERMVKDGTISSGRIVVPEGQDVLGTEEVDFIIRYVPVGYAREIEIDIGMENPYK